MSEHIRREEPTDRTLSAAAESAAENAGTSAARGAAARETEFHTGRTPWDTVSGRVLSVVSRKGGVGKTTSVVNLGAAFALSGHSVLLVGLDPQCGIARSLGFAREDLTCGLDEVFQGVRSLHHLAQATPLANLFFVSPNIWTLQAEEQFEEHLARRPDLLVQEIDRARNFYDTILIDCPPSFGSATRAGLLAADSYLVPVQAEELCRDSLARLLSFIETFTRQTYSTSPLVAGQGEPLRREGLFLTMVSPHTRMSRHVAEQVGQAYADDLLQTVVPRTTRLTEMALRGKPAVIYDRRSPGSRAYFNLADEILMRYLTRGREDHEDSAADALTAALAEEEAPLAARGRGEILPHDPDGLDRLLRELRMGGSPSGDGDLDLPDSSLAGQPEMVSLDDVLAEEERLAADRSDWEAGSWSPDQGEADRLH